MFYYISAIILRYYYFSYAIKGNFQGTSIPLRVVPLLRPWCFFPQSISIHGSQSIEKRISHPGSNLTRKWTMLSGCHFLFPLFLLQQLNGVVKNGLAFHYNVLTLSGLSVRLGLLRAIIVKTRFNDRLLSSRMRIQPMSRAPSSNFHLYCSNNISRVGNKWNLFRNQKL